jgi:hypothetical protein
MKIDRKLNLVIPIYDADNDEKIIAYVHSTPITSQTFEVYWEVLGVTFNYFYSGGLGLAASARLAAKALKKCAIQLNAWEGDAGVERGLMAEIHRLTNVLYVGDKGWQSIGYYDAKKLKIVSEDDLAVVESAIVFFTVFSVMHRKKDLPNVLAAAYALWGARIESLSCTEFMSSLVTSTESVTTGVRTAA